MTHCGTPLPSALAPSWRGGFLVPPKGIPMFVFLAITAVLWLALGVAAWAMVAGASRLDGGRDA